METPLTILKLLRSVQTMSLPLIILLYVDIYRQLADLSLSFSSSLHFMLNYHIINLLHFFTIFVLPLFLWNKYTFVVWMHQNSRPGPFLVNDKNFQVFYLRSFHNITFFFEAVQDIERGHSRREINHAILFLFILIFNFFPSALSLVAFNLILGICIIKILIVWILLN